MPSVLFVAGYVFVSGFSIFHAISGKFFLREFSKIFFAELLCFLVILLGKRTLDFGKQLLMILAGVAVLFGLCSVEAASTGLIRLFLEHFSAFLGTFLWFEPGTRLVGIIGNANVLASVLAFGVIFSVMLLYSAENKKEKLFFAVYSGITAYAFLLCFSMGALACFSVSVVLYLVFSGKERSAVLIRMLIIAFPTLVFGFLAFPCFERDGIFRIFPLLLLSMDITVVYFLETRASETLVGYMEQHGKLVLRILCGICIACVAFLFAAYHVSVPHTFGKILYRSAYPKAGTHHLELQADGDVTVQIISQTRAQTMMHTNTEIYQGTAKDAVFTVPEGSVVCYFTFSAEPGTKLSLASIDGKEKIRLKYLLLPGSIANRLQGLWANQNFTQRLVFHRDGLRLFLKHPILGNGVGAFEAAVTSIQDFYYETKYVHNHYIQILLETGLAGFVFYAGALLYLLFLLIKKRKQAEEAGYGKICPALISALVMLMLHSAVEISLSSVVFLCMAYMLFGIIALFLDEPFFGIPEKKGERYMISNGNDSIGIISIGIRVAESLAKIAFALTIIGNLYAGQLANGAAKTESRFFRQIEEAASLDLYDKNDYKLSYLYRVAASGANDHLQRANQYAEELLHVQSNSIPEALTSFYIQTGQFEHAVQAAMAGAVFSASDAKVWNYCISMLRGGFGNLETSTLLTEDAKLLPLLAEYIQMWKDRNQTAMEPIELEPENADFFSKIEEIET